MRILRSFRIPRWGKILTGPGRADDADAISVIIAGLETIGVYANAARIGGSLDVTIDGAPPTGNIRFGSTPGGTEYGNIAPGALPFAVPGADDTGDPNAPAMLYVSSVEPGEEFTRTFAIRAALPSETASPSIALSTDLGAAGPDIDDVIEAAPAILGNMPAAFTRSFNMTRGGQNFLSNNGSASLFHTITAADDNLVFDGVETVTCSGGVLTMPFSGAVQIKDFEAPEFTSPPVITSARIGSAPAFTPPVVTGNPTPAVTYDSLVGGGSIGDETDLYTEAHDGSTAVIQASASNGIGGPVTESSAGVTVQYNAPTVTGSLPDRSFTEDTGTQSIDPVADLSAAVAGDADLSGVTFSLPTTIPGVTVQADGSIEFDTDLLSIQSDTAIVWRIANSGGQQSRGFNLTITEVGAGAATLSIDSIGPQGADGDVPATYTISENDSPEFLLVRDGTSVDEQDIGGGQTGPNVFDLGTIALTAAGSGLLLPFPEQQQGNFRVYHQTTGGAPANSALFALDTTDAVLSPVSFTPGSAGEVNWSFTPDEISAETNGYRVSLFPDGSTPTDSAIKDGTGAVATTTGTVDSVAAESGSLTGVASTVYVPAIYYIDAFGNETFETYADVTAGAAASGALTITAYPQGQQRDPGETVTIPLVPLGTGKALVALNIRDNADAIDSVVIAGVPASIVTDGTNDALALVATDDGTVAYEADVAAATGDIVVNFAPGSGGPGSIYHRHYLLENFTSFDDVTINSSEDSLSPWSQSVDVVTQADWGVISSAYSANRTSTFDNSSGVTLDGTVNTTEQGTSVGGSATGSTPGTQAISWGDNTESRGRFSAISIAVS